MEFQCLAAGRRRGSGANCAAPERRSSDRRRHPRHFIAEQEKCPGKLAYYRTKMRFDPFHPAEIVLARTNRCRTLKNPVTREKPPEKNRSSAKTARNNPPRYQNSRIREATSSSSHFGVDVAPQTPARSSLRNHSGRTSAGLVT